jgi:hypothetical protein
MSGQFLFTLNPFPIMERITANTAKVIVDATNSAQTVANFEVNENAGGTQNLTVEIYDGTNHHYLSDDTGTTWNARPVLAYKGYKFSGPYPIPLGSKLQITSSDAAGKFNVFGAKLRTV